jgi:hypothetical protein
VAVCVDLDDDVEVTRGIHRNFVLARGHLVLTAAPATSADDLIRAMLITLNVLWRLPAKLRLEESPSTRRAEPSPSGRSPGR